MKILTIDGIIYSLQRNGGISVYFNELQQRLQDSQISYELIKTNSKLKRYINPRMSDNRIFHSSYYRTARGKNVINITTVYDFTYEFFASGIKRIVHSRQKFNAIKNSECIICISENTKNDLLSFLPDIDSNKIYVTPLGPSSLFHPLHIENKSGCPYILFVGARGGYKNFRNLVLALSMLKDINLKVVGGGYFTNEEKIFLDKYMADRYEHMGMTNTEKLNELYNQALALAYPSSYEGFGIPILEAMRSACPVIAINSSSIPEVAGDAAILLERADPELLKSAILSMCDFKNREQLISKGIERANLFSWDKTFEKTLSIYEKLNGGPLKRLST